MKRFQKIKNPKNLSRMSRFIRDGAIQLKAKFALANLMKKVTWYLFILTPLRIANKLALRLSLKGRVMTP